MEDINEGTVTIIPNGFRRPSRKPSLRMASGVPNYKVILCGEYGVGKSSIFRRFLNNTFTTDNSKKSTVGLDQCTRPFAIGKSDVKLTLWDTGGMERMSFIGSSYYRGAHAALLCYNSNNKETFTILSQYILDIVMNAEGAKIFLCGNMADGDGKDPVEEADLDVFMSECEDVLSGVYNVSCKDNWGLAEMFQDMARVLHTDAMNRMTIRRDLIRPGETPELDGESQEKKRCC
ncbi:ras-related protein Rab-35-like isoform X2 [Babylonia areolata]|uniref:ras-related protein Rab-35-like isoform X2 n=1 Tax=Babylonia areolata TaxID=304850 RepID=UPI003FD1972C